MSIWELLVVFEVLNLILDCHIILQPFKVSFHNFLSTRQHNNQKIIESK